MRRRRAPSSLSVSSSELRELSEGTGLRRLQEQREKEHNRGGLSSLVAAACPRDRAPQHGVCCSRVSTDSGEDQGLGVGTSPCDRSACPL